MVTDIKIPPAALEAGWKAVANANASCRTSEQVARAAFLAMIDAWEGMSQLAENDSASIREMAAIILPLPTEASDE